MRSTQETKGISERKTEKRGITRLRVIGWTLMAVLLLIPAIAMQFSDQVVWTASDFLFAAVCLIGTGLTIEITVRKRSDNAFRAGVAVALAAAFLLTWSNAAVGFVGSGANPANVLYFMLLPMALTGAFAARFQADGMSITMVATALAQALITAFAFTADLVRPEEAFAVTAFTIFFIVLWTGAALLFHKADRNGPSRSTAAEGAEQRSARSGTHTLHFSLSILTIILGLILILFMVHEESEPGTLPLVMLIMGASWFLITYFRKPSLLK